SPPPAGSQHPPELSGVDQSNHVVLLATNGIKVRDFAYENTLPPVTTVPRFSVQTQPRVRPLKRTRDLLERTDDEESDVEDPSIPRTWYIDSDGSGVSRPSRYRKKAMALCRTLTEPADDAPASQGLNTREGGFALPRSQRGRTPETPPPPSPSAQYPTTPHRPHRDAQTSSLSPLTIANNVSPVQASQQGESQETESWIDTPLVTPNGSLQWPVPAVQNTSAMPASQLESVLPQHITEEETTLSQLGFSPERSQPPAALPSSPAGTPSRRRPVPQIPPPADFHRPTPPPPQSRPGSSSPPRRSPRAEARPGSPRYHFRQRPAAAAGTTKHTARGTRATSQTRSSSHSRMSKAENATATTSQPPRKRQKPSPPAEVPGRATRYGLRKNGDV
ncbi:hypothetical protein C8Q77DRAFT_1017214, partial [Trametes polyzona]